MAAHGFGSQVGRGWVVGGRHFAGGAGEEGGHDAPVAGDEVVLPLNAVGRGDDGQVFEVGLGEEGQGELGDFQL